MKAEKIVSIEDYRKERHGREHKARKLSAGFCLPSADRLWELLDRNINISVWREQN
jgi:hypothetical protein